MTEQWATIPSTDGFYEASTLGRIRRVVGGQGAIVGVRKLSIKGDGYLGLVVCVRGHRRQCYAHELVLEAFSGARPPGQYARHLNGTRTDNRPENLAWGTASENARDKITHGTILRGMDVYGCKLSDEKIREIRTTHNKRGVSQGLSCKYGVSARYMRKILKGESRVHVH